MRDGRRAERAQAAELARRPADELVVGEEAKELGVVVVDSEHEAQLLEPGRALGTQAERAVGALGGDRALDTAVQRRAGSRTARPGSCAPCLRGPRGAARRALWPNVRVDRHRASIGARFGSFHGVGDGQERTHDRDRSAAAETSGRAARSCPGPLAGAGSRSAAPRSGSAGSVTESEPTEAELEEQRAKERLREAEAEAKETLEQAEELAERDAERPHPDPDEAV